MNSQASPDPAPDPFGERLDEESQHSQGPLPHDVDDGDQGEQDGRGGQAHDPPECQPAVGLRSDLEDPRKQRPGQEKEPHEKDHCEDVEDALHDHGPDGEALADALLLGQVKRLDDLSDSAGEDECDRETHDVSVDHVRKTDIFLLMDKEVSPAEAACEEVQERQGKKEQE